ncbi:major facilitator superfamily transporter AAHS family protein [Alicycliphilus sp. B1]|nr:major facilitator superfamily transporter AAHS family protein [Alicycliphilus sp. B1]
MSTVASKIPSGSIPTVAATANSRATIGSRLERLPMTGYQRRLFAIIATAWFFDSMDLGIMTFVLGSIKTEFGLTAMQTGLLASSSFLGMFLGAATAGMLADKFGRKPVFQLSMIFWGVGSLMCGLSHSANELMAYRVLLGFGMGMEFPIGLAMVSEIVPAKSPRWPGQIPPPLATPNSPRQDRSDYDDSGVMAMRAAASLRR